MNSEQSKSMTTVTIVGAVATLIFAMCKHWGITMDGDTQNAVTTIIMALGTWIVHREIPNA